MVPVSNFRLLPRLKQRRPRRSQRKMLIPMYRRHLNLRKLRQLKPRVKVKFIHRFLKCRIYFKMTPSDIVSTLPIVKEFVSGALNLNIKLGRKRHFSFPLFPT